MRDIREDLQERVELVKQQINAEQSQFEKLLKQLSSEQDSKVRYVKAELETVKKSSRSNIDGLAAQCPFRNCTRAIGYRLEAEPTRWKCQGSPYGYIGLGSKADLNGDRHFAEMALKAEIMDTTRGLIVSLSERAQNLFGNPDNAPPHRARGMTPLGFPTGARYTS